MSNFPVQVAAFALGLATIVAAAPAHADHAPVFVVPSRPGVPVVINGRNAAWSVVEGDWGLSRPGHMPPSIIGGGEPLLRRGFYTRHPYHPSFGSAPPRGRHEIEPPADRLMPEPAETFTRGWSTHSEPYSGEPPRGEPPRHRPQSYNSGYETLPPNVDDAQQPFPPPIVVVPHRSRRP